MPVPLCWLCMQPLPQYDPFGNGRTQSQEGLTGTTTSRRTPFSSTINIFCRRRCCHRGEPLAKCFYYQIDCDAFGDDECAAADTPQRGYENHPNRSTYRHVTVSLNPLYFLHYTAHTSLICKEASCRFATLGVLGLEVHRVPVSSRRNSGNGSRGGGARGLLPLSRYSEALNFHDGVIISRPPCVLVYLLVQLQHLGILKPKWKRDTGPCRASVFYFSRRVGGNTRAFNSSVAQEYVNAAIYAHVCV